MEEFCLVLHLVYNWTFGCQGAWGEGKRVWLPCNHTLDLLPKHQAQIALYTHTHTHTHTHQSGIALHPHFKSSQRWSEGLKQQQGLPAKVIVECVCVCVCVCVCMAVHAPRAQASLLCETALSSHSVTSPVLSNSAVTYPPELSKQIPTVVHLVNNPQTAALLLDSTTIDWLMTQKKAI